MDAAQVGSNGDGVPDELAFRADRDVDRRRNPDLEFDGGAVADRTGRRFDNPDHQRRWCGLGRLGDGRKRGGVKAGRSVGAEPVRGTAMSSAWWGRFWL